MALQNRVTPHGEIVADPARGRFTGNRGIIHDPATRTLLDRRWSSRAWIVCVCDFRDRRRRVMATRSWTELFFLDEATALAAGHRPCFTCRRADALRFRDAWAQGAQGCGGSPPRAPEIDRTLDAERRDGRAKRLHPIGLSWRGLPDGAMIGTGSEAFVVVQGRALRWSHQGYAAAEPPSQIALLTPPSTTRALAAGYAAQLHPSATAAPAA
jgi:hypothetical protein